MQESRQVARELSSPMRCIMSCRGFSYAAMNSIKSVSYGLMIEASRSGGMATINRTKMRRFLADLRHLYEPFEPYNCAIQGKRLRWHDGCMDFTQYNF